MNTQQAIEWLEECAKYFDKMQASTEEDRSFWAYGKNAANARAIAELMKSNSFIMYEDKVLYGDKKSLEFVSDLIKEWMVNAPPRKSAKVK